MAPVLVSKVSELQVGAAKRALVDGRSLLLVRLGACSALGKAAMEPLVAGTDTSWQPTESTTDRLPGCLPGGGPPDPQTDGVTALDASCPHAKASLAFGVLSGERVLCPLHLAVFEARTGAVLEPPACSGVARYPVTVEGDQVSVDVAAPLPAPAAPAFEPDPTDPRTFVVVGGGPAGAAAVSELRAGGYRGRLVLVSDEAEVPYERPDLSKAFLLGLKTREALAVLAREAYDRLGVELILGQRVTRLDAAARRLDLADGTSLACELMRLNRLPDAAALRAGVDWVASLAAAHT